MLVGALSSQKGVLEGKEAPRFGETPCQWDKEVLLGWNLRHRGSRWVGVGQF